MLMSSYLSLPQHKLVSENSANYRLPAFTESISMDGKPPSL